MAIACDALIPRDFYDGCKEAAQVAVWVMRGESPASIPFQPLSKSKTMVSLATARRVGLVIPETSLKKADKVIDK